MNADRTHQERFLSEYARPNDIASEVVRIFRRDGLSMLSDDQLSEVVQRLVDDEKATRIRNRFNRQSIKAEAVAAKIYQWANPGRSK
jgi:hypothetical protein